MKTIEHEAAAPQVDWTQAVEVLESAASTIEKLANTYATDYGMHATAKLRAIHYRDAAELLREKFTQVSPAPPEEV